MLSSPIAGYATLLWPDKHHAHHIIQLLSHKVIVAVPGRGDADLDVAGIVNYFQY